ncbi:MAG: sugar transferase [Sphingomonadaceae bacterium]
MRSVFDSVLAAIGLFVLLPVLIGLSLLVLVTMGQPVLFLQQRSGKNGHPFTMVKFRTMNNARNRYGELLPDIDRVSAAGRFLRTSRLDELPGLYNIMRGEMHFVGPRPLLPETIGRLGKRGKIRGSIKPGLTGWAQVNGNTLLSLDRKIALDIWYVRNASLMLDLRIVWATLRVMIGGERDTGRENPTV